MIRKKFFIYLLLIISQSARADAAYVSAPFDTLNNVPALQNAAEKKMVSIFGGIVYESLSKRIAENFSGSVLLDTCVGSFLKLGKTEAAVALYNASAGNIKYYVVEAAKYSNGKFELVGVSRVANESIARQDVPPLVRCESATSIARIHELHRGNGEEQSTFSNLKKTNFLDSLCLPNGGLIPGYTCFEKVGFSSHWKSIGHWGQNY